MSAPNRIQMYKTQTYITQYSAIIRKSVHKKSIQHFSTENCTTTNIKQNILWMYALIKPNALIKWNSNWVWVWVWFRNLYYIYCFFDEVNGLFVHKRHDDTKFSPVHRIEIQLLRFFAPFCRFSFPCVLVAFHEWNASALLL